MAGFHQGPRELSRSANSRGGRALARVVFAALCCLLFLVRVCPVRADPLPEDVRVDRIEIYKAARMLMAFAGEDLLKTYTVALGFEPVGPKERQGDGKTPEGEYHISGKNPGSSFHLSLRISYPNDEDRKRAAEMGVSPGGDIMIHGLPNGYKGPGHLHTMVDWTLGCIALTNEEIEELYRATVIGAKVVIYP